MSKGVFDDNNLAQVAYTGSWTPVANSGAYASTLHSTTQSGASATVSFTGSLGRVIGTVPQCSNGAGSVSGLVVVYLDGSMVLGSSHQCGAADKNGVVFYDSGTLLGGNQPHKLSVVNQGDSLPFQLDMFVWAAGTDTGSTTAAAVAQAGSTASPTTSSTTKSDATTIATGSSGSITASLSESSTASLASSISTMSGKSLVAAGAAASSSMQLVTINGVVTSMMVAPTPPTGPSGAPGRSTHSSLPVGPIVGGIIGFLLLILLLILLYTRCRRRRNTTNASTQRPLSTPEAVTPFQVIEGASNSPPRFLLDLEVGQETKIDPFEDSSPPASGSPDEKRAQEPIPSSSDSPSSESQPSTLGASPAPLPPRPISTISSFPSDAAPAYRPRYRSDMSTLFNLNVQPSHVEEGLPSYDSVRNRQSSTPHPLSL